MIVKLLTERHLEFLSLKGCCTGSSESTLVKMSNCWKSRALAQLSIKTHADRIDIFSLKFQTIFISFQTRFQLWNVNRLHTYDIAIL